jgi:hypothetical protein
MFKCCHLLIDLDEKNTLNLREKLRVKDNLRLKLFLKVRMNGKP